MKEVKSMLNIDFQETVQEIVLVLPMNIQPDFSNRMEALQLKNKVETFLK